MRTAIRRPPGPRAVLPWAALVAYLTDTLTFLERTAALGDVAHFGAGGLDVYLISRPDLIHDVLSARPETYQQGPVVATLKVLVGQGLLTSEDPGHRRQRRLMQPLFHRQAVSAYARAMGDAAAELSAQWDATVPAAGGVIDMAQAMTHLSMQIVLRTLFSTSATAEEVQRVSAAITVALRWIDEQAGPLAALTSRLPLPSNRRMARAVAELDTVVAQIVSARRGAGEAALAADLLSQLLQVRDSETGAAMSDRELRDELMTFFLAGHETTAVGLAWAWWYLAQAPEIQDTLAGEAAALGGQPSTLEELSRVPSAENVFAEALRLRPPVYMWPRRAMMEQTIGDYVVPAGTCLLVSQWVTHRDRRWWPEPERFDPGRWLPERRATQPRGAYFPFNRGARRCIGEAFAWMEAQVVLATIAQRWHMSLVPGGAPIMPAARVTLRPRDGVPLFVTRRPPASQ